MQSRFGGTKDARHCTCYFDHEFYLACSKKFRNILHSRMLCGDAIVRRTNSAPFGAFAWLDREEYYVQAGTLRSDVLREEG